MYFSWITHFPQFSTMLWVQNHKQLFFWSRSFPNQNFVEGNLCGIHSAIHGRGTKTVVWACLETQVKEESEKVGLKLNIQKTKIMASGPITS